MGICCDTTTTSQLLNCNTWYWLRIYYISKSRIHSIEAADVIAAILHLSFVQNDQVSHAFASNTTAGFGRHSVVKDSAVKAMLQGQQGPAGRENGITQQKRSFGERGWLISSAASSTAATGLSQPCKTVMRTYQAKHQFTLQLS